MTKTRFEQIYLCLHLADNTQAAPAGHDKLYKIRKLLDILTAKFQSNYVPNKMMTIDEAMIPLKVACHSNNI